MSTKNYVIKRHLYVLLFVFFSVCLGNLSLHAQVEETDEEEPDSTKTGHTMGQLILPNPTSIVDMYVYDPETDMYIYTQTLGDYHISHPLVLTPEEYQDLILEEEMKKYFKEKSRAMDAREGEEDAQKNLLPTYYVRSDLFESIFGGNTIEIIPQGSVEMDLGVLITKQDNPAFSPRNRSNTTFDFNQRISLSLLGQVGDYMRITANYDTQSTFDFQNQIKLEYTPTEDEIIQSIEVGNVSMPLNTSLIQGAQSLFGVKAELQFGKTRVTGIFSEQKSESTNVVVEGGALVNEFEVFALDYDEDRHFFLAHYFRDNYDRVLENYPFINSSVQITRAEVWITNTNNQTDDVRNLVAIQDIGESNPNNIGLNFPPGGFINKPPGSFPDNSNNDFNPFGIDGEGQSVLNPSIRNISTVQNGFGGVPVSEGQDFVVLENARKLQPNEYSLNTQLGYVSLNQRLTNDEILAVAFQFTVNGKVYQVGEFSNDGVNATGEPDPDTGQNGESQNLVVKMLRSNIVNVNEPAWDLMMKNIYNLDAFQLEREDFRLDILYTDPTPLNYINPAEGSNEFPATPLPEDVAETTLLRIFNLDKLNYNNDPVQGGDGFFDFYPGITVDAQNGRIVFTSVEPFGEHLFEKLSNNQAAENYNVPTTYNANQNKYVFRMLYESTKVVAEQEQSDKNKFQLKGRYKSSGTDGISIGAFNLPPGSVTVTAGGRVLAEGVDYTVNYQLGTVQILDQALLNSNTPINISTENNAVFGQQIRRFSGFNIEHQFSDNFLVGTTFLNLNERPLTQKTNLSSEPINNSIIGFNANYSTEVPFLTRMVNKLPNIDTDVPSNVSVRGEFAYLIPGSPKFSDFDGKTTVYVDDFEGSQTLIDMKEPLAWFLASTPIGLGGELENNNLAYNYNRAKLSWYTVDPIFYSSQRPSGITDEDLSNYATRRAFIDEIFPDTDIEQGQTQALFPLNLTYYPTERGPYNYNPETGGSNTLPNPASRFGGIARSINTTNFEQSNVEYIQFWLMDPFIYDENQDHNGGVLKINLGNISENILKTGRKQYENGLPADGGTDETIETAYGKLPSSQSLIYAFDTDGQQRTNQDIGLDGASDAEEAAEFPDFAGLADPAGDNYEYFLQAQGNIVNRYKNYNGTQGNSPVEVTNDNRGSTTLPDVEDYNRDNTMNTVESYFEYEIEITPSQLTADANPYITDVRERDITLQNGEPSTVRWVQFKIPVSNPTRAVNGIADFRSIRFMRMFLTEFEQDITLRFGTLDLVRGDYRRYTQSLNPQGTLPDNSSTTFEVESVNIEENSNRQPIPYVLPPGVFREELINNNSNIRQNEQSLAMRLCGLEPEDARAVFKNYNIDMRQYKNLEMFIHAESLVNETPLNDGDLVAFIRMGNDLNQNYYEVEIPLNNTPFNTSDPERIWPIENRLNLPLKLLQEVKSKVLGSDEYDLSETVFFDESELDGYVDGPENDMRIGIKGNPSFGAVRTIMIGVRNGTDISVCGEVWVNELRLSEIKNEGGWAAIASMDANVADFANVSASGGISTVGFGSLDQGPNQRSIEDVHQYDLVTNLNLGQLLPRKWGIQLPFNYGRGEELITPLYDQELMDIELETRLDNIEDESERERVERQSTEYTKRQSINFIGVRKERTGDKKPMPYDVENLTFSYSYNQVDHRSYEIEESLEQNVRVGATYDYSFNPKPVEPFQQNDSLFRSPYLKLLKDFNFNYLPTNISMSSNIVRQYNEQRFRDVNPIEGNIGLPTLYQRNFLFDWQYAINFNVTKSLRFNFNATNNRIVNNFIDDAGIVDNSIGVWDGFFNLGEPNQHFQTLQVNYDLPFSKIPFLKFIRATYSYTGDYQWQKGSDLFKNVEIELTDGTTNVYDLGNTIQNSNTHRINSTIDFNGFYRYIGLTKKRASRTGAPGDSPVKGGDGRAVRGGGDNQRSGSGGKVGSQDNNTFTSNDKSGGEGGEGGASPRTSLSTGDKAMNFFIGLLTSIKRAQLNYQENNGIFMPGYTPSIGFMGSLKPTTGFVFGGQGEIRDVAARNGWLTLYPEFNEQYTETETKQLDYQINIEPFSDLRIDLTGNRMYTESYAENYIVNDDQYRSLTPNVFGNFNISTIMIRTAFQTSDEFTSEAFDQFRENRLVIANRLAEDYYGTSEFPVGEDGYPEGFGKNKQSVLLASFLAAYQGQDASKSKTGIFRDVPLPNWDIRYTGLMRLDWFKKNFKRFSIQHGYRSGYTVNQFQRNLDYDSNNPEATDQAGNIKEPTLLSNVNLIEQFSPLIKVDFETRNAFRILGEIRTDRALSLSFANNLLTEIQGTEYIVGFGYRIKDLRIGTNIGGNRQVLKSDLNFKLDLSLRDNKTIIRYLDSMNSDVTAGQTIYGIQLTADYALSKNLTALLYYDHTFSEYAISTAFPQTTIRTGLTLRYTFGN